MMIVSLNRVATRVLRVIPILLVVTFDHNIKPVIEEVVMLIIPAELVAMITEEDPPEDNHILAIPLPIQLHSHH